MFSIRTETSAVPKVSPANSDSVADARDKSEDDTPNDLWSMVASMGTMSGQDSIDPSKNSLDDLDNFEWHLKLDENNKYTLDWTVKYVENEIIFGLNINQLTSGFRPGMDIFALGFSEYGELHSADFCFMWYDLGHQLHLQDAKTDSNGQLSLIESSRSHCKLESRLVKRDETSNGLGGVQWAGEAAQIIDQKAITSLVFKRPLDICQETPGLPYYGIDNGTTHLVWFQMAGPLLSIDGLNLVHLSAKNSRAGHREAMVERLEGSINNPPRAGRFEWGMRRAQLVANKAASGRHQRGDSRKRGQVNVLNLTMDKFKIPAQETTYWCKLFKLPHKFETKRYHMTKYEAVIERGNEHIVHHMELFNCANLDLENRLALDRLWASGGYEGHCGDIHRPKATDPCKRVIAAWAMGAHPLEYPEQVGQSIGGHNYSPYLVLEVHYNNIQSTDGLVDNSGLRFHYTGRLRPYDAGILEVGLEYTDKNSIPPNMVMPLAGYCVSECTRAAMPCRSCESSKYSPISGILGARSEEDNKAKLEDGIYIFAGQLHTHLAGISSWTELFREGELLREIQRDNHYSPHFQEIRLLPEPVHVAPGDALVHYCLYDTRKRTNITLGGFATSDEMCVTYLHYYPRIELEVCKSSVDNRALEAYFAYLANEEDQQTSSQLLESHPVTNTTAHRDVDADSAANTNAEQQHPKSVAENYRAIEWTRRRANELVKFYSRAPLSVQCNRSDGHRFPGYWNGVAPTSLWPELAGPRPFDLQGPDTEALLGYRGRDLLAGRHAHCARGAHSEAHVGQQL